VVFHALALVTHRAPVADPAAQVDAQQHALVAVEVMNRVAALVVCKLVLVVVAVLAHVLLDAPVVLLVDVPDVLEDVLQLVVLHAPDLVAVDVADLLQEVAIRVKQLVLDAEESVERRAHLYAHQDVKISVLVVAVDVV
jgi:hypothetical protein